MRVQPKVIEAKRILDEHARNPRAARDFVSRTQIMRAHRVLQEQRRAAGSATLQGRKSSS